jgi:hypothetical protein
MQFFPHFKAICMTLILSSFKLVVSSWWAWQDPKVPGITQEIIGFLVFLNYILMVTEIDCFGYNGMDSNIKYAIRNMHLQRPQLRALSLPLRHGAELRLSPDIISLPFSFHLYSMWSQVSGWFWDKPGYQELFIRIKAAAAWIWLLIPF